MKAIILAGGLGTRLRPLTMVLPKPLMPIGNIPIIEVVLRQLVLHKFDEIVLSVGYLAELIMAYCGNGDRYGVKLSYVQEDYPLGTVGPLTIIPDLSETFLLINGDILTTLNFSRMLEFHNQQNGIMTLAVQKRSMKINFGVVDEFEQGCIRKYVEKPILEQRVGMGICMMDPAIFKYMQAGERLDIPDLIARVLEAGETVAGYESSSYWLDIGRPDDYERAISDFERLHDRFFSLEDDYVESSII